MKAYIMGNFDILDVDMYMEYTKAVRATSTPFGAQTLIAEPQPSILEGTPHEFTVVVEFPSKEAALAWYHSSEYQAIVPLRKKSTKGFVQLVSQFSPPKEG